jgi:hypothetical protein
VVASSLSISRAWDETREIFQRDGRLLVAVALALIVLPEVVAGLIAPPEASPAQAGASGVQILRLAVALISLVGQLALIRLALGPSTTVGSAIGHGARRFPSAFGAIVILVLALVLPLSVFLLALGVDPSHIGNQLSPGASVVLLLYAIAALAISVRFTMVSPVASAENIGPIAILKRSWQLTSGHYFRLLGFILLLLVATLVLMVVAGVVGGLLARLVSPTIEPMSLGALLLSFCAGAAQGAFSILASAMLARVYVQVSGENKTVEEVFR